MLGLQGKPLDHDGVESGEVRRRHRRRQFALRDRLFEAVPPLTAEDVSDDTRKLMAKRRAEVEIAIRSRSGNRLSPAGLAEGRSERLRPIATCSIFGKKSRPCLS